MLLSGSKWNSGVTKQKEFAGTMRKRAFTLVELLVVISVIALLTAILMPALAAARSVARSVVCKSNIRQLTIASIGYGIENDGFYVPAASDMWVSAGYLRGGFHRWHGVRDNADEPFDPLKGPLAAYLGNGKVKQCPQIAKFVNNDSQNAFEAGCGGYGYNMTYLGSRLGQRGISFEQSYSLTARTSEVLKPSETLMFADTAFCQHGRLIEYSFAEPPFTVHNGKILTFFSMQASIHFRHRGQANIGWVDGHIGSREIANSEGTINEGSDSPDMNLGWFEPIDNTLFDLK